MLEDNLKMLSILSRFPYFDKSIISIINDEYFDNKIEFDDIVGDFNRVESNDKFYTMPSDIIELAYPAYCCFDLSRINIRLLNFIESLPSNNELEHFSKFIYSMIHLGMMLHTENANQTINHFNVWLISIKEDEMEMNVIHIMHDITQYFVKFRNMCDCNNEEIFEQCELLLEKIESIL